MLLKSSVFLVSVISISVVSVSGFNNEEYGQTSAAPDIEEELHMDSVPTGYLPDSVYRELAWYGILQIQPLYYSTKHKVAARWIWQNTLGRPHVILENSAQTTEFEGKGGQTLMEESAKWVRDQRTSMDVLMENIRAGGNGLTVRTVISSTKKSAYIIQSGKTYECGPDSEPDIDAFRAQSNMHERRCTEDKEPKLVPLDMCMEAESTPVEYSYVNGWNFCMGDGERDSSYKENGDLDCGQKKKVAYSRFLEECAIDKNVVITFDYYGDEPRKDLIRNTTLCTTWDPCRFSYLYRIEISDIDKPDIPTTTPDPCDTTFCPECVENFSEESYIEESLIYPSTDISGNNPINFLAAGGKKTTHPSNDNDQQDIIAPEDDREVLPDGEELPPGDEMKLPLVGDKELPPKDEKELPSEAKKELPAEDEKELPAEDEKELPSEAEKELPSEDEKELPAEAENKLPSEAEMELPIEDRPNDVLEWVQTTYEEFPKYEDKALKGGYYDADKKPIYVMRAEYKNLTIPGKLLESKAFIGYDVGDGVEPEIRVTGPFEIAIPKEGSEIEWVPGHPDSFGKAVPGGIGVNGQTSYVCRALADGNMIPGRFDKINKTCNYTHRVQMNNPVFEMLINKVKPTKRKFTPRKRSRGNRRH